MRRVQAPEPVDHGRGERDDGQDVLRAPVIGAATRRQALSLPNMISLRCVRALAFHGHLAQFMP